MSAALLGRDVAGVIADQAKSFGSRLSQAVADPTAFVGGGRMTKEVQDLAMSHFEHHTGKTGAALTEDALGAIMTDARAGLKPGEGAGLSNIGKGNILTNAFNVDAGEGVKGNLAAMAMGGALGFAGAAATDGDAAHGAFIGSLVGGGIKGIGTGLAKNMEKRFVTDLLGDKAGSYTAKEATGEVIGSPGVSKFGIDDIFDKPSDVNMPGPYLSKTYGEIGKTHPNMTPKQMDELTKGQTMGVFDAIGRPGDYNRPFSELGSLSSDISAFEYRSAAEAANDLQNPYIYRQSVDEVVGAKPQAAQSVRQQQIAAVGNMSDDALKGAGMGAKFKKDVLTGESGFNIGTATRISGVGGAALTGMGFSAKKRDHRRGFNKHRGNRV